MSATYMSVMSTCDLFSKAVTILHSSLQAELIYTMHRMFPFLILNIDLYAVFCMCEPS